MSVERTASRIRLLLEVEIEKLSKGSPRYDSEYIQRDRGSTGVPFTEEGLRWLDDGLVFTDREGKELNGSWQKMCRARMARLRSQSLGIVSSHGLTLREVTAVLAVEPGSVRWMENGESKNAKAYWETFMEACRVMAERFHRIYPEVELKVVVDASEKRTEANTPVEARRIDEAASRRSRYEKLIALETTGVERPEAKRLAAAECGVSVRTIERDAEFCEGRIRLEKKRHSAGYVERRVNGDGAA